MSTTILKNGTLVSGSTQTTADLMIKDSRIHAIGPSLSSPDAREIDCTGLLIMPGMIDTHVHFRDPGFPHKGDCTTESRAAVAGGVTSVCDMPNTNPQTTTIELLRQKQAIFAHGSLVNYGIYIGASTGNLEELKRASEDPTIPAIKIFMAESTGEMTLSAPEQLEPVFRATVKLIAVHAENEALRLQRLQLYKEGKLDEASGIEPDDPRLHSIIRNNLVAEEGTRYAVELALKYHHRTHILHVSARQELAHIQNGVDLGLVSAETCPHYLLFHAEQIAVNKGLRIMNPALKEPAENTALLSALQHGPLSQIATDHAPHTLEEKQLPYGRLPAGLPGIQFALINLLNLVAEGHLQHQDVVRLYAEAPSVNYRIQRKGYLREGYDADITIVDPTFHPVISHTDVLSRCGWTPYEGIRASGGAPIMTFVNGNLVFDRGKIAEEWRGKSLQFVT